MLAQISEGTGTAGNPVTGDYQVTGQEPDILVLAGNRVVPAQTIYAREKTYGIEFQFTIAQTVYAGEGPNVAAADRAMWLQQIGADEHVQAVWVDKDTNAQGFLRDYVFVTVGTDDGLNTTLVRILLDSANTPGAFQAIADAWSRIEQTLGVTTG